MGIAIVIVVFLLMLNLVLIIPLWSIIDTAASYQKTSGAKAFWIIALLFTWTLGGLFYGLLFAESDTLRNLSILGVIVFLIIFAVIASNPEYRAIFMAKLAEKYVGN